MKILIIPFFLLCFCELSAQTRFMYDVNGNMIIAKTKGVAGNCITTGSSMSAIQLYSEDSIKLMERLHTVPTLSVTPNPATSLVIIDYYIDKDCRAAIQLMSSVGQRISIMPEKMHRAGYYRITYNMQPLVPQLYFICLQIPGSKMSTIKVMKQ